LAAKAAKAGDVAQVFSAADGASGKQVVNFDQLATKAAKAGDSLQKFSAADGTTGKEVVNRDQLDDRTSLATDLKAGIVKKALMADLLAGATDKYPDADTLLNGFFKDAGGFDFPMFLGGLQIRTGTTTHTQTEGNFGVSFNRPFSNSCDFAFAIYENTGAVVTEDTWFQIVSKSTSGATFYLQAPATLPVGTRIAHWFAIGR
jgi:hypothetical protein